MVTPKFDFVSCSLILSDFIGPVLIVQITKYYNSWLLIMSAPSMNLKKENYYNKEIQISIKMDQKLYEGFISHAC